MGDTIVRPAVIPFRWRGKRVDVCVVIEDGETRFIARDIMLALGQELDAVMADEPSHAVLADHARCISWSWDMAVSVLQGLDDDDADKLLEHLRWCRDQVARWKREALATSTSKPAPVPVEVAAEPARLPEYFSVAAAAKILDRDPSIDIGQRSLFDHLHKTAWIRRDGNHWIPNEDLVYMGYLISVVRDVKVDHEYPQLCITPQGVLALHQRLGGTASLNLAPRDQLTLIQE